MRERAFLPITPEVRDRANEYLENMAARGFGCTIEQAVQQASAAVARQKEQKR